MDSVKKIIKELFQSVDKYYLCREYFFAIILYLFTMNGVLMGGVLSNLFSPVALLSAINTILYPFAKLTLSLVCSFVLGNQIIILPLPVMFIGKIIISFFIYVFSIFISPISIGYILIRNRYTKNN